jgi:hypothetical protein
MAALRKAGLAPAIVFQAGFGPPFLLHEAVTRPGFGRNSVEN